MIKQINENTMNLDTFYNHVKTLGTGTGKIHQIDSSNKCKK
jgi:hypothetical protein